MTYELGQKIQKVYGFGLKIAILNFLALSASTIKSFKRCQQVRLKTLSAVGYTQTNFLICRLERLTNFLLWLIFSAVG